MISQKEIKKILDGYDKKHITIGVLGGHSALDVCRGVHRYGFKTLVIAQKGREKTYQKYFKRREGIGFIDDVIVVNKFSDITKKSIQDELRRRNTIFVHNRYFWVYCNFKDIENKFKIPIYGTRDMVKLEERDVAKNQYYLLEKARIRLPKIFKDPKKIDRLAIVKVPEATRSYERAFFLCSNYRDYKEKSSELLRKKTIKEKDLKKAVIEEYVIGAHVNFNFFYSPLDEELELLGTDTRRQTNLDGFLRLPADEQLEVLKHMRPKMIETGHYTVTIKESLLEKVFAMGEKFVKTSKKEHKTGIIGPFALQGAVVAEDGREDIVIFDVSMRIPGSPGSLYTPYSAYLYGYSISYGERIGLELKRAIHEDNLFKICT